MHAICCCYYELRMTRGPKWRLRRYNVVNEPYVLISPKVKF